MIMYISKERESDFLSRKISNNVCRYFTLEELEHDFPPPNCELHAVTSFPKSAVWKRQGKSNFTVQKLINTISAS